ncbi:MAG: aldo/keto reductase, partial [Archangium sp.]
MTIARRDMIFGAAVSTLALRALAAGEVMPTRGTTSNRPLPTNSKSGRYRPTTRLGLGGVAIGNGFAPSTDQQTLATLEAAWKSGVRYFDTSPFYGYGLSERRFGAFLHGKKPDEYVV